jgi:ankyrin repeat protein
MSRALTPGTSLDSLKKEAKRWLKALRARDDQARGRLARVHPNAPAEPGLRDVQHALALEHGFAGWVQLRAGLAEAHRQRSDSRTLAVQALLAAAGQGDTTRLSEILDRDPGLINERGVLLGNTGLRTALHFGVGHEAVVKCLLDRGADPNIRDEGDAAMPLHFAAENQDLSVIRLLIEHGADPIGTGDHHELEVIGWATGFDYVSTKREVVEYLLAHGARHNIFSAVATGEVESIRTLVARSRPDLDKRMDRTNHRRRPLHLAVVKKQAASLDALLDLGVDVDALDEAGLTALDQAALDGEAGMAQRLIDRGAQIRLPAAVGLRRTHDIDRLLREDPECLAPGRRWGTLIVRASESSPGDVIEALILSGASVDVWDEPTTAVDATSRYSPLHAAASRGNAGAAAALLKHGANPSVREDRYCSTPAGWANYFGRTAVRDLILAGPIDIFDALDFDLTDRIPDILRRDPGALNRPFGEYARCQPRHGQWWPEPWSTPLVRAVVKNNADAARLLLEHGAASTVAPDGRSLQDIASEEGREQVAEVLRTHSSSHPPSAHD